MGSRTGSFNLGQGEPAGRNAMVVEVAFKEPAAAEMEEIRSGSVAEGLDPERLEFPRSNNTRGGR